MALRECAELGDETIAVVFFLDVGLQRCQQMFADLNRYAIRPSPSLGVLYDHRDSLAQLARLIIMRSSFFRDIAEMERTTLSPRSRKLFTLSALYNATSELLNGLDEKESARIAIEYWEEVAKQIPEWGLVRERKMAAGEVRQDFIHSHGIVLQALGNIGNTLLREYKSSWKRKLKNLKKVDWSRSNRKVWEGRAMIGGRVSKATQNVTLTTNALRKALNLEFTPEGRRAEDALNRSSHGS